MTLHAASERQRTSDRDQWLREVLRHGDWTIAVASADASFRSYWRVTTADRSMVLMDAPPEQEDCQPFLSVARQLAAGGLHAPEVISYDLERGFVLLEDLGQVLYSAALNQQTADALYDDALAALLQMQQLDTASLPAYDDQLLRFELSLFHDWLLERHLSWRSSDEFAARWKMLCDALVSNALSQPTVFVHRDYHCRNLMVVADNGAGNNPGIVDFQDAVAGPITYDLVSLLRDCYIGWPAEQVRGWAEQYRLRAVAAGLTDASTDSWRYWFDLMGLQRHLKAAGIFCRLKHRDNKPAYLRDVPRTLSYAVEVCAGYPELKWFGNFLQVEVLPAFSPPINESRR